jgi:ADP-ribose pyrophosphatase YjhB (NUDIX family)
MNKERVRPIAICLFSRGDRILVSDAFDSAKGEYFCRPLGGEIEFGEQSRDAMLREIREETGAEVESLRLLGVLESIFTYEGERGHELVFVYDAEFADKSLYEGDEVRGYESELDMHFTASWRTVEDIERSGVRLVPEPLAAMLAEWAAR